MRAKKYILSMAMVYMAYFTHGIQAIILSQNKVNFFTQWGYTDEVAGAAAVSLAITATGFGKFLTVWLGGEISDKIGRKKMAVAGGIPVSYTHLDVYKRQALRRSQGWASRWAGPLRVLPA